VLAPLVQRPASPQGGRPPKHPLRQIIDAFRYLVRSGCAWRLLPASSHPRARCTGGLPGGPPTAPWPGCTIPSASRSASRRVATLSLGGDHRLPVGAGGRHGPPTQREWDAGTWRWTPWGLLLVVMVTAVSIQDRDAGRALLWRLRASFRGRAAVLGRWRVRRQAGRLGCGGCCAWGSRSCASARASRPSRCCRAGGWWSGPWRGSPSIAAPCAPTSGCPTITPRWSPGPWSR
jgi:Putative transposase of IS4/5 family (DUF4096)